MTEIVSRAFILAAGKGTRLRPYTDTVPKPMVEINGRSIIRRALEKLDRAGVEEVVINLHHLAPVLENHLSGISRPRILLSHKESLLDTGGGMFKMLRHFQGQPFFAVNGDALWEDEGPQPALEMLQQKWRDESMDCLLLLQPVNAMTLTNGVGDYDIDKNGRAVRNHQKRGRYMFAGVRIVHPRLFQGVEGDSAFSFLELMDAAEKSGRLHAVTHTGAWHHISTPEELERVDAHYRETERRA